MTKNYVYRDVLIALLTGLSFFPDLHEAKASFSGNPGSGEPEFVILSVYDNYSVDNKLQTAWGFSCLVKTPQRNVLFDTGGDADKLLYNMKQMGIDPYLIDDIVISHIHSDHRGGLIGFLDCYHDVTVHIPASFPDAVEKAIIQTGAGCERVSKGKKVCDHVYLTGEVQGSPSEQALVIESAKGLVVITGCAHPGIVQMVKTARKVAANDQVFLVVGGFHRPPVSVVSAFRNLGVKKVAPSHCTGEQAIEAFKSEYQEDFISFGVGQILKIQ